MKEKVFCKFIYHKLTKKGNALIKIFIHRNIVKQFDMHNFGNNFIIKLVPFFLDLMVSNSVWNPGNQNQKIPRSQIMVNLIFRDAFQ